MKEKLKNKGCLFLGKKIITFIGPEGSGKTTNALKLADDTGLPYVTTGDTIRDLAANDQGELGDECRAMFAEGRYLSGETLLRILVERFSKPDVQDGLILDGGLRTLEETRDFFAMLEEAGLRLPMTVIYLEIPEEETYERLVRGKNARKRFDDTEEGVASRLEKFNKQLEERLDVIKNQPGWELVSCPATAEFETVYAQVCDILTQDVF